MSPRGDAVAFRSNDVLYLLNIDDRRVEYVMTNTASFGIDESDASFTPDGRFLIFMKNQFYAWDRHSRDLQATGIGSPFFSFRPSTGHPSRNSQYFVGNSGYYGVGRRELIAGRGLPDSAMHVCLFILAILYILSIADFELVVHRCDANA